MGILPFTEAPARVILRIVSLCCALCLTAAARLGAQADIPVIQAVEPVSVCQGCVMQVSGSRLVDNDTAGTRLLLLRDQQRITVAVRSFSRPLDDQSTGEREALTFGVPSNAATGPWQLIVERGSLRSAPVTFHVAEWTPPTLDALSPIEAAPGQRVTLAGSNLPAQLFIDLIDQSGRRVSRIDATATPHETGFSLPEETPEGNVLVRLGARNNGVEWHSQSLPMKVTVAPNVSIDVNMMAPVAPGQWTMLVMDGNSQGIDADRVDVEFRQDQDATVSSHDWDQQIRIRVPSTFAPGPVSLRARVWRAGRSSPWSPMVEFGLLPSPAEAVIHAIAVVRDGNPSASWSRIDASPPLEVHSGDRLLVGGDFPFASSRITLTATFSPGEPIPLRTIRDRGDMLEVDVPQLAAGEWILRIHADDSTNLVSQGVVVRVER